MCYEAAKESWEGRVCYLRPHSQTVTVLAGRTVTVDLVIDSGLR
jgi:hypothetical protein